MAHVAHRFPIRPVGVALLGLVAVVALFIAYVAFDVYWFAQQDQARTADAAIVLGAAAYGQRPSPVLRERINHALLLYEQGYVESVIFTGGQGDPGEPSEGEVAARYALARGLPAEAIVVETTSTSTRENLANAQALAAAQGLDSFLLVSTPFHMRRAVAVAGDLGMEVYSSPTRTIPWISPFTRFRAYAREVVGYLAYLLPRTT
ncbi:MAG: YdcF family protein [Candidatus Promineifilaceae bacterium]|nr:YdcF family protein [Candidatus Promineifilaceae bacterium]